MGLFTKLAEPKHDVIKREPKPKLVDADDLPIIDECFVIDPIEINFDDYEDFVCYMPKCNQEVYTMARYGEAADDFTFVCSGHLHAVISSIYIRTEYLKPYIENGLFNIRSYKRYWEKQVIRIIPMTETPSFDSQPALMKGSLVW